VTSMPVTQVRFAPMPGLRATAESVRNAMEGRGLAAGAAGDSRRDHSHHQFESNVKATRTV
jgi:hypothetical protein